MASSETEFFERQADDSKDCSVHSLNNALGFHAIDPEDVAKSIDGRLEKFAILMGMDVDDPKLLKYRGKMATGDTFFSADSVWVAAKERGVIDKPRPIAGFGGDYARVSPDMMKMNLVILGVRKDKAYHAIGARDGKLYDSLSRDPGPAPLADETLAAAYKKIFAAFRVSKKKI